MYNFFRILLFLLPPESAHHVAMFFLKTACSFSFFRRTLSGIFQLRDRTLETRAFGLSFRNAIGMGAGFDKNAQYLRELEVLGFGFVEIGTVTPKPQDGNPKPRLFRLPKDKALINRMGFNNEGVEVIAQRLKNWRRRESSSTNPKMIIGGNIGKNKITPNEDAWKDYEICFRSLHSYVDFFVVNVSSPNTPGLRELQEKDSLKQILVNLQNINREFEFPRPILLKIAPDLTWSQIDDVIDLAGEIKLDGLVATNTTISREGLETDRRKVEEIGAGGLSGLPLKNRATEVISYINNKTSGSIPLIGSGGIFNANDAKAKFLAGSTLVEVWTGFIYEGPGIVKKICRGLS